MTHRPVEVVAMGWVDVAERVYFRWWLGEPRPEQPRYRPDFQVAECAVEGAIVLLITSVPPEPSERQVQAVRVVRDHFGPDALIALSEAHGTGWSRLSPLCPARSPQARLLVARAVAVIHASWGWDESAEIRVEDQEGVVMASPRRVGGAWGAEVRAR